MTKHKLTSIITEREQKYKTILSVSAKHKYLGDISYRIRIIAFFPGTTISLQH